MANGTAPDLREERVQFELGRFGGQNVLQQTILPGKDLKQRQVGIVAHGEDVGAGTLTLRHALPVLRVPTGQLAILNGSTRGAAVTQQYQIRIGAARPRALLQRSLKHTLQIGAAAEFAGAHEIESALHAAGFGRNRRSLKSS